MIALDTNILIYAVGGSDPKQRDEIAKALIRRLPPVGAIVPVQVIAEFLNACRRKKILSMAKALVRADEFLMAFTSPCSLTDDLLDAGALSARIQLAYFDALIITVAARAGATLLLSEDMQDGLEVDGLRVVNPFVAANAVWIDGVIDQAS